MPRPHAKRARDLFAAALTLGAMLGGAAALRADEVVLYADRDNTLYESATGALSNGAGSYFFAGNTGQSDTAIDTRRGLLHFDVGGAIPAGSTVIAAVLAAYMSRAPNETARDISLHRLLSDWGEGTSNDNQGEGAGAPATPGDATWIHTDYDTGFWSSPGGDFSATASATTAVSVTGQEYTWSSAAMAADVNHWLENPAQAFGWIVVGDESVTQTSKRFSTREDGSSGGSRRARLTITFVPPINSGACCAGDGSCELLEPLDCTAGGGIFQGVGVACTPNPCPQPIGACCASDGSCGETTAVACAAAGGVYHGDGSLCSEVVCPVLAGACCVPGSPGICQDLSTTQCGKLGGEFLGDGSACGVDLCPFVDPLPLPAVAVPVSGTPGGVASYLVPITEESRQLHRDLPPTTVWTYAGGYPGPTLEASVGAPVTVTWWNDLRGPGGELRTEHFLPVDPCMHGPDTEGPTARVVTHLHGGHVPPEADGYPEDTLLPGEQDTYVYPNQQLPATLWYHDHALGITRLNVQLGLAGFYLLRDAAEAALGLPAGEYEIALAIQDRSFRPDGAIDYPALWEEHFFGDRILVNGKVWPFLEVRRGKYRFRLLDGSNSRAFRLALSDGATFHQIGTDGGLLEAPVPLTEVLLLPGERADVVIDFAGYAPGTVLRLVNDAPAPFPGTAGAGVVPDVLEFRVVAANGHTAALPATLREIVPLDEGNAVVTRDFELQKLTGTCTDSIWKINGLGWHDITERPVLGDTEIWRFVNRSGITHPMHMHLVMFQILDRQPFEIVGEEIVPTGPPVPPPPSEAGWKDTVAVHPFEIARVIARFEDYAGHYAYHCHVLEHEDHEMMRQFESVTPGIFSDGFESHDVCAWSAAEGAPPCP